MKMIRNVKKRSTFRRKSNSNHVASVQKRAAKNNRLSGKAAR